jgi:hypothetical protein
MSQLKLGAAGVVANEIDISGPRVQEPSGIPAGVVGTAARGPAFVPITVGVSQDFESKFGKIDSKHFGPLAVYEWLKSAQSVAYLRVLGVGDGKKRQNSNDNNPGSVTNAGFVVGENQPSGTLGKLDINPFANVGGDAGRTYFLGCFMSESLGSRIFSEVGVQNSSTALPIIRGVLMAPSGVVIRLSSSVATQNSGAPSSTAVGSTGSLGTLRGTTMGSVDLSNSKQEFVLLLNGHKGLDSNYPNVITASFDPSNSNYFASTLNKDPYSMQEAGHYLYAHWDIHPALAAVTGAGLLSASHGADAGGAYYGGRTGVESSAFVLTSSLKRNEGSATVPNFESFEDRFRYAKSPWVISQKFGGKPVNLFRFHAIDAGANVSTLYKISIQNISPPASARSKYGSFTVVVRPMENLDITANQIASGESFTVDLDPTSNKYIGKVIGDLNTYYDFDRDEEEQKMVIEGNYPNKSNYIRVEIHPDVENGGIDASALPMGVRGISHLVTSGSGIFPSLPHNKSNLTHLAGGLLDVNALKSAIQPPIPMRYKVTEGPIDSLTESVTNKYYWGHKFELSDSATVPNLSVKFNESMKNYAKYFPDFATTVMSFVAGDNAGTADTEENGILDSDRFCNNLFTLEHIQVVTGSGADALADGSSNAWKQAKYIRNGAIANTNNGKRALEVRDLDVGGNRNYAKFTFIVQGGFNGVNIFDEDESKLNGAAVSEDMVFGNGRLMNNGPNVKAYTKAIDIMKNTTNLDIQLFTIPGIRHPIVTDYAMIAVEDRFDALYIMDVEQYTDAGTDPDFEVKYDDQKVSATNTLQSFKDRNLDSSFAAAYFPDVSYEAPDGNNIFVPPSVLVLGAMSLNDSVGHPWFAPAGYTRGVVSRSAKFTRVAMNNWDLDSLYNERVNPLTAFQDSPGIVVWGQKTLQLAASSLDRINVRRLLIEIRRQVRDIAQSIIFEPNREATLAKFSAAVTPRLQRIQNLSGLERFKVIIDSSTTTQTDIENNTVRGKIYVQPTKTIEFVSLDFVVANNLQQVQ